MSPSSSKTCCRPFLTKPMSHQPSQGKPSVSTGEGNHHTDCICISFNCAFNSETSCWIDRCFPLQRRLNLSCPASCSLGPALRWRAASVFRRHPQPGGLEHLAPSSCSSRAQTPRSLKDSSAAWFSEVPRIKLWLPGSLPRPGSQIHPEKPPGWLALNDGS